MFTTEQRHWVTDFTAKTKGGMGRPPEDDEDSPPKSSTRGFDEIDITIEQDDCGTAPTEPGYDEIDILIDQATHAGDDAPAKNGKHGDDDLGIADAGNATDMTCSCTFHNHTTETLTVDQDSLDIDNGKLTTLPDAEVEAGKDTTFSAENTKVWTPIPFVGDVAVFGIEGHVKYTFPDGETTLTLSFDNPRFEKWGKTSANATVTGPMAGNYKATGIAGSGNKAAFKFAVHGSGGGDVPIKPDKPDTPAGQTTNCLVTVTNQTDQTLTLDDQQNLVGDFMSNPPNPLAPGASGQFVYVGTPHGTEPGCKGFARYFIGPTSDTWRIDWSNPVGEKNTATAVADSTTAGYHSLEQIGQGEENVPVTFTLAGQGGGGGGPVPPKPGEDPPFTPPASAKQPTLRKGDKAPDGWVEYLQEALLVHGENVKVDGDFGAATLKAVQSFQTKNKLQVDGTVGNQTWAALREGAPQPPSTDGRTPHTFKEDGLEARFFTERDVAFYNPANDGLFFTIVSVGDPAQIEGRKMTLRLTPPGSKPRTMLLPITDGAPIGPTDQGALFMVSLDGMTRSFPSTPPGAPGNAYLVEAYIEQELGGDSWSGNPSVAT